MLEKPWRTSPGVSLLEKPVDKPWSSPGEALMLKQPGEAWSSPGEALELATADDESKGSSFGSLRGALKVKPVAREGGSSPGAGAALEQSLRSRGAVLMLAGRSTRSGEGNAFRCCSCN